MDDSDDVDLCSAAELSLSLDATKAPRTYTDLFRNQGAYDFHRPYKR